MIMKKSKKCFNLNIDGKETLNTFGSSRGELLMIDLDDVFKNSGSILYNLPVSDLIEEAITANNLLSAFKARLDYIKNGIHQ